MQPLFILQCTIISVLYRIDQLNFWNMAIIAPIMKPNVAPPHIAFLPLEKDIIIEIEAIIVNIFHIVFSILILSHNV